MNDFILDALQAALPEGVYVQSVGLSESAPLGIKADVKFEMKDGDDLSQWMKPFMFEACGGWFIWDGNFMVEETINTIEYTGFTGSAVSFPGPLELSATVHLKRYAIYDNAAAKLMQILLEK